MSESRFKITSFKDIKVEEVQWLWKPYFPLGTISFIAGDPGIGKTFLTTFLASVVSKGEKFPFSDINAPIGQVIIQNGEDGKGITIKQRLNTFNANDSSIHIIELKKEREDESDLLLKDVNDIDLIFEQLKPKLVIFDPITNFLGDIDMNSATRVRQVLKPIVKLAEKYNCAIVFVIHRNKGIQGGNQLHRLLGSVDFGGIARSVVSIGINPNNKEEKLFMHTKHNLSERGLTIAFKTTNENGIVWLGTREYLQDDEISNNVELGIKATAKEIAKEFIVEYLEKNGKSKYDDILSLAIQCRITEKTLNRARDDLKEEMVIDKEYKGRIVYWYLLEDNSPFPQGV
ncbi:MAG: AAA family ATPase [Bacilli bacterium]|nr:AAA family ATPase [Bacilli bacterium]